MKLPFVDAMQDSVVNGSRLAMPHKFSTMASLDVNVGPSAAPITVQVCHKVELLFNQRVDEYDWHKNSVLRFNVRKRAAKAMARHLYGPLDQKLMEAKEAMWRDGTGCGEAEQIIDEILQAIRGDGE